MTERAADTSLTPPGKAVSRRKARAIDLAVNKAGSDFRAMTDAYATGERVGTKGMTREQVIKLITG